MFTYHCFLALEGVSVLTTNTPIRTEANLANNDLNDKDSIPSIQSSTDKLPKQVLRGEVVVRVLAQFSGIRRIIPQA